MQWPTCRDGFKVPFLLLDAKKRRQGKSLCLKGEAEQKWAQRARGERQLHARPEQSVAAHQKWKAFRSSKEVRWLCLTRRINKNPGLSISVYFCVMRVQTEMSMFTSELRAKKKILPESSSRSQKRERWLYGCKGRTAFSPTPVTAKQRDHWKFQNCRDKQHFCSSTPIFLEPHRMGVREQD